VTEQSTFIESHHLDINFELEMAPDANVCVVQDKLSRHAQWKHAQARWWGDNILPSLIRPFMRFQREWNTGARVDSIEPCVCLQCHHLLKIVCVHMEYLGNIDLVVCSHCPAAIQLVGWGLFPCSPLAPTLAVSMDMLEFVSDLFVNMAPNEQAWATTLTKYLKAHGHEFATGDSLC
jgi:CxC1 like cysteine cluster associated with KDZ transposases